MGKQKALKVVAPKATEEKQVKARKAFQPALLDTLSRIHKLAGRQAKRIARAIKRGGEHTEAFVSLEAILRAFIADTTEAIPVAISIPVDFALPKPKSSGKAWDPTVGAIATWAEVAKESYAFTGSPNVTVLAVSGEGRRMRVTVKSGDHTIVCPRADLTGS